MVQLPAKRTKIQGGLQQLLTSLLHDKDVTADYPPMVIAAAKGSMGDLNLLKNNNHNVDECNKDGVAPLMAAVSGGHLDCQKMLLHHSASIDQQDKQGRSALFYAIFHNQQTSFDLLVKRGANVKLRDSDGMNILHIAANFGRITISEKILNITPKVTQLLTDVDSRSRSALHYAVACKHEDITEKLILQQSQIDEDFLNLRDGQGMTVLHYSCQQNDADEWVEYLLEEGADMFARDSLGQSVLHLSAIHYNHQTTKLILSYGSDNSASELQKLIEHKSKEGYTALHYACLSQNLKVFKLLISALKKSISMQKSPFNISNLFDSRRRNLIHIAGFTNNVELCKLIHHYFPPICTMLDDCKRNALFYVARNLSILTKENKEISLDCLTFLIEKADLDISQVDITGRTVLHFACFYNIPKFVQYLLKVAASKKISPHVADDHKQTPLHVAAIGGYKECLRLLILMGADVNCVDEHGQSALHLAAVHGHYKCIDTLIQLGADVNLFDAQQKTALHYACQLDLKQSAISEQCVKILLQDSTQTIVTNKDKNGISPLSVACATGNPRILRELLHHLLRRQSIGAGIAALSFPDDFIDNRKWSPMHHATYHGHAETLRILFDFFPVSKRHPDRCMMLWKDVHGMNALHIACSYVQSSLCCKILLEMKTNLLEIDNYGRHALHIAASVGNLAACELLIGANRQLLRLTDNKERNSLAFAKLSKNVAIIEYISAALAETNSSESIVSVIKRIKQTPVSTDVPKQTVTRPATPTRKVEPIATTTTINGTKAIRTRTPQPVTRMNGSRAVPIAFPTSTPTRKSKQKDLELHSEILELQERGASEIQIGSHLRASVDPITPDLDVAASDFVRAVQQLTRTPATPTKSRSRTPTRTPVRAPIPRSLTPHVHVPPTSRFTATAAEMPKPTKIAPKTPTKTPTRKLPPKVTTSTTVISKAPAPKTPTKTPTRTPTKPRSRTPVRATPAVSKPSSKAIQNVPATATNENVANNVKQTTNTNNSVYPKNVSNVFERLNAHAIARIEARKTKPVSALKM